VPEASRAAARREAGLCTACGTGEPAEGRGKCEACLVAARASAAARRDRAAAKGLCEACMRRKRAAGRGNRCGPCADKYLAVQNKRAKARRREASAT
jgi:hypothetical protein